MDNNKNKTILIVVAVIVILGGAFLYFNKSKKVSGVIIGTWVVEEDGDTTGLMTFKSDGTVTMTSPDGIVNGTTKYGIENQQAGSFTLKIYSHDGGNIKTERIIIKGQNELEVDNPAEADQVILKRR